ncbi:uncharacterized protein LOC126774512 isoform X1 [Nymphalis io]|uniref:uncharacterized protein LOC126774512 isoform X1 n=1 Tax=Inachis io TaxID=171585 RepID=UPI0021687AA5|nr:uncharacterized protein LOC126774512 isoform X1 [Nymphalis io]
MTIKLVRVDASNCTKIQLGHGEHIIGRGKLLDCNDKRISREHGELLIDDSTVTIKALHLNPCFFKLKDSKGTEILQLGSSKILNNGDRFGLLPDDFWYEIIYCPEGEDFGRSDSEKNTEEYSLADAVPSDSHTLNSNKIKVDGLHASNINNDDTYNNSSRPESPSLLSMHNDDTIQVNQNKPVSNNNKPVQPKDTEPNSSNSLQNHSDEEKTENGDESSEKSPSIKRSHSPDSYDVKKFKTVNVVVKVEPDDVRPGPSDTAAGGNVNDDAASRDKPNRQRERCIYGVNCYSPIERVSHPSSTQVEALVTFLEERPSLAKGFLRNPNARARALKEWDKITTLLNNTIGGSIKSSKKWIKYWSDKKSAVKRKAVARNAARLRTGGAAEDIPELSEIEERILALMSAPGFANGDEHLPLQVFDEPIQLFSASHHSEKIVDQPGSSAPYINVNALPLDNMNVGTYVNPNITVNQYPRQRELTPEHPRQAGDATTVRDGDNTSATLTSRRRTFRSIRRSPPSQRHSQFNSMADKFLKLEDQRIAHEGRVVKVMEEMARTHNVLAEGVKAQAEAHIALGEGLKALGEGLKALAESIKNN